MTSNVVNYMVIIETDNLDGKLYPYMTASVSFEEPKRSGVLVVPNGRSVGGRNQSPTAPATTRRRRAQFLDRKPGRLLRARRGRVGATDGTRTEVYGERVQEGMKVIVGIQSGEIPADQDEAGGDGKPNMPFLPKFPKKGPPKGGPPAM